MIHSPCTLLFYFFLVSYHFVHYLPITINRNQTYVYSFMHLNQLESAESRESRNFNLKPSIREETVKLFPLRSLFHSCVYFFFFACCFSLPNMVSALVFLANGSEEMELTIVGKGKNDVYQGRENSLTFSFCFF